MTNQVININYTPFDYQKELHNCNRRFMALVGGRRVGKSQTAMMEIIRHCLSTQGAVAWWVAQTYRDAKEVGWEMFIEHAHTLAPAIHEIHRSNLHVEFINGSKLYFKGSDNPNSLRGRGLTFCVMDEAAFQTEETWKKSLRPALSDKKGRAIFTSTPNGRNWYFDLWSRASYPAVEKRGTWKAFHWPTHMNPIIGEEELHDAREDLSEVDYRQEYLAHFVTKGGMVYADFSDDNIITDFTFDPTKHDCYLGMDFGYANPSCIVFMAVDRASEHVIQFDEIYVARTPIHELSELIREKQYIHRIPEISALYSDPAGNAEELSSGLSPVDYLRQEADFKVINKGTRIQPGLALVRSFIKNANGEIRFHIHSRCKETIRSFYGYTYKLIRDIPQEEPEKDNRHDHAMDAVRYFFVNRFDHAKYIMKRLHQEHYGLDPDAGRVIMKRCKTGCGKMFPSRTPKTQPPFKCNECLKQENLSHAY